MIRHRNTDGGVEFFFDYQADRDAFIRFVEAMQEPSADPESASVTARLLEGLKWADARDPYGATLGGLCTRVFRHEIHQRDNAGDDPRGFDL